MCKSPSPKLQYVQQKLSHTLLSHSNRKCVLKSREQVEMKRRIKIPASIFLQASRYGFDVAKTGLQQLKRGTLYWHDPWGIREALLYSLRNACIALDCCDASYAKWLRTETQRLARTSSNNVRFATRALEKVMSEAWTELSKTKRVSVSNHEQLNFADVALGSKSIETSSIELSDGGSLPRLGFGTAIFDKDCECAHGQRCQACTNMRDVLRVAVTNAVKQGYRHFDCAQCYNNEDTIGEALKASDVQRKHLFLTSKLSYHEDYGSSATPRLVRNQLQKLQTSYLDLYYLHDDIGDYRKEKAAWRALERLYDQGVIKHLGLSNYRSEGIERIMSYARVYPSVVQVKYDVYHPGYQWAEDDIDNIVAFAQSHDIAVVGYASFSGWPSLLQARNDPHVCSIAQDYDRSPTQILLRHGLQKGLALIPASVTQAHIKSNKELFDFSLSGSDVAYLDSLASLAECEHVPWLVSSTSYEPSC